MQFPKLSLLNDSYFVADSWGKWIDGVAGIHLEKRELNNAKIFISVYVLWHLVRIEQQ